MKPDFRSYDIRLISKKCNNAHIWKPIIIWIPVASKFNN
jgi:hypothetical protein